MTPFLLALAAVTFKTADDQITLMVDARQAGRNFIHSHLSIRAKPGPLTLVYPKWIPGEHSPTGPINDVVGLHIRANGKDVAWRRDDVDMFAIHLDVPADTSKVELDFDLAFKSGSIASPNFARIKWNRLLWYPQGSASDAVHFEAAILPPNGWRCATALKERARRNGAIQFDPVSLTRLVDSPALIGRYSKTLVLRDGLEKIELFGDNEKSIEAKPESIQKFKNLVTEAHALFGAHHYDTYRFLLTLSNHGGDEGLEHHETSEDGTAEESLSDESAGRYLGYLLSHEYTHSWNGKYRRPTGLATANFQDPMKGELLWVYEGMTEYIGTVLDPRSGLWSFDNFKDALAQIAAMMEFTQGRTWRPLVDTARSVQLVYSGDPAWSRARRGSDYYNEMVLIWLEADVKIRQLTGNKKSLDDFCKLFHGGQNTGPKLETYTFDDVVSTLNRVAPNDWSAFLHDRVYAVQPHAPTRGIEESGWKVVYTAEPNEASKGYEGAKGLFLYFSIGVQVTDDAVVQDVLPDSPAARAGLSPGMKLIAVNGMKYTADRLKQAVADSSKPGSKVAVVADCGDESLKAFAIGYRGGARYPHLVRDTTKPDLLSQIAAPRGK